jgi:hypothetical protein
MLIRRRCIEEMTRGGCFASNALDPQMNVGGWKRQEFADKSGGISREKPFALPIARLIG